MKKKQLSWLDYLKPEITYRDIRDTNAWKKKHLYTKNKLRVVKWEKINPGLPWEEYADRWNRWYQKRKIKWQQIASKK